MQRGGKKIRRLCKPCQNKSTEKAASSFCRTCDEPLCKLCTEYHRKVTVTKQHIVIPLTEMAREHNCQKPDRFCFDHEKAYCSVFCLEKHRNCRKKSSLKKAVAKVKKEEKHERMLSEVDNIQTQLKTLKSSQEEAKVEVEDQVNQTVNDFTVYRDEINKELDRLEKKHSEELAKGMKSTLKAIEENITYLSRMIDLSSYCKTLLANPKRKANCSSYVERYYEMKKDIKRLQSAKLCLKKFKISQKFTLLLKNIKKVNHAASLEFEDKSSPLTRTQHIPHSNLKELETIFSVHGENDDDIRDICFLENTDLLVCFKKRISLLRNSQTVWRLPLKYKSIIRVAVMKNKIFRLDEKGNIYVGVIDLLGSRPINCIKKFPVRKRCYGMSVFHDSLLVGCENAILQLDLDGNEKRRLSAKGFVYFMTGMKDGNVVYASKSTKNGQYIVRSINTNEQHMWLYDHHELEHLAGLSKDCAENIYLLCCYSKNIHVINSATGEILKIFENIPNPTRMIFKEGSYECYLVSSSQTVKLCKVEEEPLIL